MAVNADAKTGFWTAVGVLAALFIWNLASNKFPALRGG